MRPNYEILVSLRNPPFFVIESASFRGVFKPVHHREGRPRGARLMPMRVPISAAFAILGTVLTASASPAQAQPGAATTIVVDAVGKIPGYSPHQLSELLATAMQKSSSGPWHFVAKAETDATAPNRVTWLFKTIKTVWLGGSHNGYPGQSSKVAYLTAEVKEYLGGQYQMTFNAHPTVQHAMDEDALSELAGTVARAMFAKDADSQ